MRKSPISNTCNISNRWSPIVGWSWCSVSEKIGMAQMGSCRENANSMWHVLFLLGVKIWGLPVYVFFWMAYRYESSCKTTPWSWRHEAPLFSSDGTDWHPTSVVLPYILSFIAKHTFGIFSIGSGFFPLVEKIFCLGDMKEILLCFTSRSQHFP